MRGLSVLVVLLLAVSSSAYIYGRCELASELLNKYGLARATLGDWICLIEHESSYNTRATHDNTNESRDYGLYQINDNYWCYSAAAPTYNDCNVDCSGLIDDDIDDDVACSKIIYDRHGFDAWYGYINNCAGTDTESYVSDCGL